jgi:hypothetical protein
MKDRAIAFKYPPRTDLSSQHSEALLDGIGGRAFRSKAIEVGIGGIIREREQRQQV